VFRVKGLGHRVYGIWLTIDDVRGDVLEIGDVAREALVRDAALPGALRLLLGHHHLRVFLFKYAEHYCTELLGHDLCVLQFRCQTLDRRLRVLGLVTRRALVRDPALPEALRLLLGYHHLPPSFRSVPNVPAVRPHPSTRFLL